MLLWRDTHGGMGNHTVHTSELCGGVSQKRVAPLKTVEKAEGAAPLMHHSTDLTIGLGACQSAQDGGRARLPPKHSIPQNNTSHTLVDSIIDLSRYPYFCIQLKLPASAHDPFITPPVQTGPRASHIL